MAKAIIPATQDTTSVIPINFETIFNKDELTLPKLSKNDLLLDLCTLVMRNRLLLDD